MARPFNRKFWRHETMFVDWDRWHTEPEYRKENLLKAREKAFSYGPSHVSVVAKIKRMRHKLIDVWNHVVGPGDVKETNFLKPRPYEEVIDDNYTEQLEIF